MLLHYDIREMDRAQLNLVKDLKRAFIFGMLRKLNNLIHSFQNLNCSQVVQYFLSVDEQFDDNHKFKMQQLLVSMLLPNEKKDLLKKWNNKRTQKQEFKELMKGTLHSEAV